jgi:hypothetical protein
MFLFLDRVFGMLLGLLGEQKPCQYTQTDTHTQEANEDRKIDNNTFDSKRIFTSNAFPILLGVEVTE